MQNNFSAIFKHYANRQDNLCQVEKTTEETKWRLFGRKTISHTDFLGVQIIRLDLDNKKILGSNIISQEKENCEEELINILDSIEEKSYTWKALLEYDEYTLDKKYGVVTFYDRNSQILATFDLASRILQIIAGFGYTSYEFEEVHPEDLKTDTKITPLKPKVKKEKTPTATIIEKPKISDEKKEQLINEVLKDEKSIRIYATMNNELLQAVLCKFEEHGFSRREANMLARSIVLRAKILLKSL